MNSTLLLLISSLTKALKKFIEGILLIMILYTQELYTFELYKILDYILLLFFNIDNVSDQYYILYEYNEYSIYIEICIQ